MRKLLLCNMGGMGEQILLRSSSRIVGLWRSFLCIRQTREDGGRIKSPSRRRRRVATRPLRRRSVDAHQEQKKRHSAAKMRKRRKTEKAPLDRTVKSCEGALDLLLFVKEAVHQLTSICCVGVFLRGLRKQGLYLGARSIHWFLYRWYCGCWC